MKQWTLHDIDACSICSSQVLRIFFFLICSANHWTGFYMITASVMKGLTIDIEWKVCFVVIFSKVVSYSWKCSFFMFTFIYLVLQFYTSDFAIKMAITLRSLTHCPRPENNLSWIFGQKKQTSDLLKRQKKRNKCKVAACFLWNVGIWNKKLELLDVACSFLEKRLLRKIFL